MKILALGCHPDDIEFGCGGTLIKYAAAGHGV
jgi:LmbE family N-acetylglucosaminyl deacetylase